VQTPAFASPFSVQAIETPSHESEVVHAGVPENVRVVAVDVHERPLIVAEPVHDGDVTVKVSTPPDSRSALVVVVTPPDPLTDATHVPMSGLLLPPPPHPMPTTASAAEASKTVIRIIG
jgi:hypothetical protein